MATNTFKNFQVDLTTTGQTTAYTAPAATTSIVFELCLANSDGTNATTITVEVTDTSAAVTRYKGRVLPLPAGSSIVWDKPFVLETGDILKVTAANANRCTVTGSVLEQS